MWNQSNAIKLVVTIGILSLIGIAQTEEGRGGSSSAWYPIKVGNQKVIALDERDLTRVIKKQTPETNEALQVALNVISSCKRLKNCPLTEEILMNMVQAVFPKEIKVAELVHFDTLVKLPIPSNNQTANSQKSLAGDPLRLQ